MYAAVRRATLKPGLADELASRVDKEVVPIISSIPGFMAYYVIYGEDDTVVTVSVFEDKGAAEDCNKQIMGWIRENLGPMLASSPEAMEGEVIVHKTG